MKFASGSNNAFSAETTALTRRSRKSITLGLARRCLLQDNLLAWVA
jgi:hypothetical protein